MSKKYNICERCDLATDGCEIEHRKCFYPAEYEEKLVCPHCGHETDDYYDLANLGLVECGEVSATFNCKKCGNAMDVNSSPRYAIMATPADETSVLRFGHSDYKQANDNV